MNADAEFWTSEYEYEDLARKFERNIEVQHPDRVTSRGMCFCLNFCNSCTFAATSVKYYEYRGGAV